MPDDTLPAPTPSTAALGSAGDAADEPPAAPPGYELVGEVGRGGMGVVYRAKDLSLDRDVAVKFLREHFPAGSTAARRFLDEARITGQLQHPGVPAVHQVGYLPGGRPFLAMRLIRGRTLDELLADGRGEPGRSPNLLAVFEQVCQAVGYAHAHGVVHRDLKPANVMVGAFGEVQVMDWGLAKVLSGAAAARGGAADPAATLGTEIRATRDSSEETQAGSLLGTPAFMPPEQAIGAVDRIDERSDVFGLGAILCVILTGLPPYLAADSESARQLAARAKLDDAFARLDACGAEPELIALCRRCLAPEPTDRPADAGEVAKAVAALRAAADDRARRAELDRLTADVRAAAERKRRRLLAAAAAAVVAVLAAGTGVSVWQAVEASAARTAAEANAGRAIDALGQEKLARAEATREQRTASEVKNFLQEVLAQSGPWHQTARGGITPNLTVREAMDQAARQIDGRFPEAPLIEAEVRYTIGHSYLQLGVYLPAEKHLARAAELRQQGLGPDHRETLATRIMLARAYWSRGKHATAGEVLADVHRTCERLWGPDDRLTLRCEVEQALVYMGSGHRDRVEPILVRVLATQRRVFGPRDPDTLITVINLVDQYQSLKRFPEAEALLAEVLAGLREAFPNGGVEVWTVQGRLGRLYSATNRPDRAEPLLKEALTPMQEVLGESHPYTLRVVRDLAYLYWEERRAEDAEPLLARVLAGLRRSIGNGHPETLTAVQDLGNVYITLQRWADAEPLFREVSTALSAAGHRDWSLHYIQSRLGIALLGQKKYAAAEAELLAGYRGMTATRAGLPAHIETGGMPRAAFELARLYDATGRPAEAAKWRAEAAGYREQAPPPRPAK
jgi:hypothetical protein